MVLKHEVCCDGEYVCHTQSVDCPDVTCSGWRSCLISHTKVHHLLVLVSSSTNVHTCTLYVYCFPDCDWSSHRNAQSMREFVCTAEAAHACCPVCTITTPKINCYINKRNLHIQKKTYLRYPVKVSTAGQSWS